jgi:hypothetical protein
MNNNSKDRKVGIVAFNNKVTVYGDGKLDP